MTDFLKKYRFFVSGVLILFVAFLPQKYTVLKIILASIAVFVSQLNFSKVPDELENRTKEIVKIILKAGGVTACVLIICFALTAVLRL